MSDLDTKYIVEAGEKLYMINGVDELVFHDGTKVKFDPEQPVRMTGQEWYNRFKAEMGDDAEHCSGCSCDALEAAKKASGIEQ